MNKMVLFYENNRNNGCNFYRLRQVCKKMEQHELMPCASSKDMAQDELQTWVDKAHVTYSMMLENEKFLDWMLDEQKTGRKFIFDYDDDIFNISPFNPSYEQGGTKEVKFYREDGSILGEWKDGVDGFNIERNIKRLNNFKRGLHQADLVTTTNLVLKGVFERYSYRVTPIRNMIDLNVWKPLNILKDENIRIVYQGGWSHYKDFMEVKDALNEIMRTYPKVKLVVMGQWYPGALEGIPEDRIELRPWVDVELYPWIFKTLNAHNGMCPRDTTAFNSAKSEIKWVEYSALKIPTVASAVRPYQVGIDHNKTGFVCKDNAEWIESISKLIESKELRKDMGEEARKRIEDHYDVDKHIGLYKNAIDSVFKRDLVLI